MERQRDSGEEQSARPLLFSMSSNQPHFRDNFAKIEVKILELLSDQNHAEVTRLCSMFSSEEKIKFFDKCGYNLLHYAVNTSSNLDAIKVIVHNIPKKLIQVKLYDNDFGILQDLCSTQQVMEKYTICGQTEEAAAQERTFVQQKLALLSEIDRELLSDFLAEHAQEEYMSESVMQMVRSAIPDEEQRPSSSPLRMRVSDV